jgi:hypothetical protein
MLFASDQAVGEIQPVRGGVDLLKQPGAAAELELIRGKAAPQSTVLSGDYKAVSPQGPGGPASSLMLGQKNGDLCPIYCRIVAKVLQLSDAG